MNAKETTDLLAKAVERAESAQRDCEPIIAKVVSLMAQGGALLESAQRFGPGDRSAEIILQHDEIMAEARREMKRLQDYQAAFKYENERIYAMLPPEVRRSLPAIVAGLENPHGVFGKFMSCMVDDGANRSGQNFKPTPTLRG